MIYPVALTFIKGIGPINAKNLITYFGNAENIFKAKPRDVVKFKKLGELILDESIKNQALKRAEEEIQFAEKNKIKIHYFLDKTYPYRLKECEDSPVILYSTGDLDLNSGHFLAAVGTRNITSYGRENCNKIIREMSIIQQDAVIVSGLAYGVDSAAHKAALNENLPTIAVVAHGLNTIYPALHRSLAERIVKKGGAIVTEYPINTKIDASFFVQRNRIIAGLSDCSLIVESAEKGGALLTASAANNYNRDVFAIPGRIDDVFSQGCNNLIKTNQAQAVTSAEDIANFMGWKKFAPHQQTIFAELTEEERKIVEILHKNQLNANDLSRELNIPVQKMVSMLILMEFKGLVQSLPGGMFKVAM
jgi:DNA processing protein